MFSYQSCIDEGENTTQKTSLQENLIKPDFNVSD